MTKNALKAVVLAGILLGAWLALRAAAEGFSTPPWTDGTSHYPKQPNQAERARQAWTSTAERCYVLGITTGAAPSFFKTDRGNYKNWKEWVEGNCHYFVDPSIVTNGTLNDWFAQNTSSNSPAMLSTNRLSEICPIADDFWTNTPWRHLAVNPTNGWSVVSNVMAQLVYTLPGVGFTTSYWWTGTSATKSSYADAIADALANRADGGPEAYFGKYTTIIYDETYGEWNAIFDTYQHEMYASMPAGYDPGAKVPGLGYYARGEILGFGRDTWDANGSELSTNQVKCLVTTNGFDVVFDDDAVGNWPSDAEAMADGGGNTYRGWKYSDHFIMLYWGGDDGFEFK